MLYGFGLQTANAAPARSANDFIDSIGVNTHPHYNWEKAVEKLNELGIHHIREGGGKASAYRQLFERYGIKTTLITPRSGATGALKVVKEAGPAIVMMENHNEPDVFIGRNTWVDITRRTQIDLWNTLKKDTSSKNLPIAGPSLTSPASAKKPGNLSKYLDFANIHHFYSGRNPETRGWGSNGYGSLTWSFAYMAAPVAGAKPVVMTEGGYHNAMSSNSGHRPTPVDVMAKYITRMFLFNFSRGVVRTFPYQLFDERNNPSDNESNFGLVRYDYSNKPAFNSLKNLISVLDDPGAKFTPSGLNFTLTGDKKNLYSTLLQKRSGKFYLALWLGVPSYDPNKKIAYTVPTRSITVSFSNTVKTIRRSVPLTSDKPVETYSTVKTLKIDVPDHPVILEIEGANGSTTPPAKTE